MGVVTNQDLQWVGPLSVYSRVSSIKAEGPVHVVAGHAGWRYQGDGADAIIGQQRDQGVKLAFQVSPTMLLDGYQAGGIAAEVDPEVAVEAEVLFGGVWAGFRFPAGVELPFQRLEGRIELAYEMRLRGLRALWVMAGMQTYGTLTFKQHHQLTLRVLRPRDAQTLVEADTTIDERGRVMAAWVDPHLAAELVTQGAHL